MKVKRLTNKTKYVKPLTSLQDYSMRHGGKAPPKETVFIKDKIYDALTLDEVPKEFRCNEGGSPCFFIKGENGRYYIASRRVLLEGTSKNWQIVDK